MYDAMQRAINTGEPYQSRLDPSNGDEKLAFGDTP